MSAIDIRHFRPLGLYTFIIHFWFRSPATSIDSPNSSHKKKITLHPCPPVARSVLPWYHVQIQNSNDPIPVSVFFAPYVNIRSNHALHISPYDNHGLFRPCEFSSNDRICDIFLFTVTWIRIYKNTSHVNNLRVCIYFPCYGVNSTMISTCGVCFCFTLTTLFTWQQFKCVYLFSVLWCEFHRVIKFWCAFFFLTLHRCSCVEFNHTSIINSAMIYLF